jgi:hypothetical protein
MIHSISSSSLPLSTRLAVLPVLSAARLLGMNELEKESVSEFLRHSEQFI